MVRRRILEDPAVKNDVLFAAATEMEPDLQGLTMRQFNARYPLRVRRWELSERTRILHPSGPLSKAAAENRAAPIPSRPHLTLAVADQADGSNSSQAQDATSQSQTQTQTAAPASDASVAMRPSQEATPSLQARITGPQPTVEPLTAAESSAPTGSNVLVPRLETQLPAREETAKPGAEATELVPEYAPTQRAPRRRRASRHVAEDARAEVIMVMLRWATAIGQASAIPEVFATLSTVDDYVDRIATALDIP